MDQGFPVASGDVMGIHTKYGRIKEFISKRTQAVMPSLMQITVVSTLACIRGG